MHARPALLAALPVFALACGRAPTPPDAPDAPDAAPPDALSDDAPPGDSPTDDAGASSCAVPPGADAARIRVAVPRAGLRCVRYPFPLGAPRDAIEARDGMVYVTEQSAGRVVRLTPAGFVPVVTGLSSPTGLREAPDGALYVTEEGTHAFDRVDPATGALTRLATNDRGWTYFTLGPDGAAYVSAFDYPGMGNGAVRRVALDAPGAQPTDYATGLWVPEAMAFEPDGSLVIAEWGSWDGVGPRTRVARIPPGGGSGAAAAVVSAGPFERVYGIAPARPSGYFVADTAGTVALVRADGTTETVLTGAAAPTGMTVTAAGDLLIAEHVDANSHGATGYLIRLSGF